MLLIKTGLIWFLKCLWLILTFKVYLYSVNFRDVIQLLLNNVNTLTSKLKTNKTIFYFIKGTIYYWRVKIKPCIIKVKENRASN